MGNRLQSYTSLGFILCIVKVILITLLHITYSVSLEEYDEMVFMYSLTKTSQAYAVPTESIDIDLFLKSHSSYNKYTTSQKNLNATVLAYVTPWNKLGYEVAKIFGAKFNLIAPVWFEVQGEKKAYTVTGIPEINTEWLSEIRTVNPDVKIVPRFSFGPWEDRDYAATLKDVPKTDKCIRNVINILKKYNFDGAVIEIWAQFSGVELQSLIDFIVRLSDNLHSNGKLFVLVIPPPVYYEGIEGRFKEENFKILADYVDYFSLMTYDYSSPHRPGPNSPLSWVEECINRLVPKNSLNQAKLRKQILVGLNFYGIDYLPKKLIGEPIKGNDVIEIFEKYQPDFKWDKKWAEHSFSYKDKKSQDHLAFYPTLMSIAQRLQTILSRGTGVSIWEIGQGLNSFYSLF
ncbi:Chitinase domain-containing protein 1, variant 4 [Schistosoma haematobium]|uniref:Chitinase domain-containing protein 1 n=1 Tax=Schistosoma haematobium TaxID=6185 RepID=A0A922IRW2_SCHHA|nr:Chitinase domain-containing protein 1, variant 4 [Schistosoma haematobium]KAH9585452.1 Chitinase domain-containing protein 1, variant 4 [Schistosoma haematobium]